jgi:hypothetical protein
VWATAGSGNQIYVVDRACVAVPAGDDLAVTAGRQLRFRIYADDQPGNILSGGVTVPVSTTGRPAELSGDTYVTFPVAVAEQAAGGSLLPVRRDRPQRHGRHRGNRCTAPSGALVIGGSAVFGLVRAATPSGGILLGGSCTTVLGLGYSDTPSGGVVLGGSPVFGLVRAATPSGGLVLGGSLVSDRTVALVEAAGLVLGGSVTSARILALAQSAGLNHSAGRLSSGLVRAAPSAGLVLRGSAAE